MITNPVKLTRNSKLIKKYLGKKGRVLIATKIHTAPQGFEHLTPYFVGIIQLENKEKIPLQITGSEGVKSNQKVVIVLRKKHPANPADVIEYSLKAKPI